MASPPTLLAITVVCCVVVGVVHKRLSNDGKSDPLLSGVSTLTYPFQWSTSHLEANLWFNWDWLFAGKAIAQENTRLQTENANLRLEVESLRAKAQEAERLRAALNFAKQEKQPPLVAPVIGWLPSAHFETITIGVGTHQGVKNGSIVRTANGLVGQVTEASPFSSQVLLLTDFDSRVHVLLYHDGKASGPVGVVQGQGREHDLQAIYFKLEDKIQVGDVLKTSGYGGVFPPDVPVGTVTEVIEDKVRFLKKARVTAFASLPSMLREVLVIR